MTIDLNNNYIWGIPPYMFWSGAGLLCAIILFFYLLYDSKIKMKHQLLIYVYGSFGVIVGAKLFGVIKNILFALYHQEPWTIEILSNAGLVFYGGLAGFLMCTVISIFLIYRTFQWTLMNLIVITIPLFHGFGRIGCLFSGCCFGIEYFDFLSITYTYAEQKIRSCFPTQIVESMFEFVLFITLFLIYRKDKCRNLLKIYLAVYSVFRFFIEFLRGDSIRGIFDPLSFSQYISIAIIIMLLVITVTQYKINNRRL